LPGPEEPFDAGKQGFSSTVQVIRISHGQGGFTRCTRAIEAERTEAERTELRRLPVLPLCVLSY
jgi:hypothetical protein